jgi:hypothetical protein
MPPSESIYLHNAISLLEKTPKLIETLLAGASEVAVSWKPAPDRWSIAEVLAHLSEVEAVFGGRVQRIVGEECPALENFDPPKGYPDANSARGQAEELVAGFADARSGTIAFLAMLPPTVGERTALHPEVGSITLSEFLNHWAVHDLGHLRQIAELYRAREFHPHAGPFRKYSNLKP